MCVTQIQYRWVGRFIWVHTQIQFRAQVPYLIASLGRSTVRCPIDGPEIRSLRRLKYDSLFLQFVYASRSLCRDVVLIWAIEPCLQEWVSRKSKHGVFGHLWVVSFLETTLKRKEMI
jgi:hypothetical protein